MTAYPENEVCKETALRLLDILNESLRDDADRNEIGDLIMQTVCFERAAGVEFGVHMCRSIKKDPRFVGTGVVPFVDAMEHAFKVQANYCREIASSL